MPPGASGSLHRSTKLPVSSGVPLQRSGGEMFSPSAVYFFGIRSPWPKARLVKASAITGSFRCPQPSRPRSSDPWRMRCGLGDIHEGVGGKLGALGTATRQIRKRDDAHELLVAVDHRDTAEPVLSHQPCRVFHWVIVVTGEQAFRHDLANRRRA